MGSVNVPLEPEQDNLPPELKGKSPAEIYQYFADRERALQQKLDDLANRQTVPQAQPAQLPVAEVTSQEFWNDPTLATKKLVAREAVSRQEFDAVRSTIQPSMIEAARLVTKDKYSHDWGQWEGKVRQIVNQMPPEAQADPRNWEAAYVYTKGLNYDSSVSEAAARGKLPAEISRPAATVPEQPKELNAEEKYVAAGLGLSEESYRKGQQALKEGKWPLTMSNVRR